MYLSRRDTFFITADHLSQWPTFSLHIPNKCDANYSESNIDEVGKMFILHFENSNLFLPFYLHFIKYFQS